MGGAFVDFVVRSRGAARFRRFYVECQPDTFEAKCREIFETALDNLEAEFWDDVQKAVAAILDGWADFGIDRTGSSAGRHSHITGLMASGASIMEAKELARHADIRQTAKYTHIGMRARA